MTTTATGVLLVALGIPFVLNADRVSDRLAAFVKDHPSWMRSRADEHPATWRLAGGAFVLTGIVFIVLGLR
ncbi:MAG: hypothetical protein E6J20_07865 [Chloroflexi bacterium]|nr:MAG: hypothetical protein E6J20_07865 [Chloroflexota bacterium]